MADIPSVHTQDVVEDSVPSVNTADVQEPFFPDAHATSLQTHSHTEAAGVPLPASGTVHTQSLVDEGGAHGSPEVQPQQLFPDVGYDGSFNSQNPHGAAGD